MDDFRQGTLMASAYMTMVVILAFGLSDRTNIGKWICFSVFVLLLVGIVLFVPKK